MHEDFFSSAVAECPAMPVIGPCLLHAVVYFWLKEKQYLQDTSIHTEFSRR